MLRTGHIGISMLAYAPVAFVLAATDQFILLATGFLGMMALSNLPDIDAKLSFVKHRGPTHTVWFALAWAFIGVAFGLGSMYVYHLAMSPTHLGDVWGYLTVGAFCGFIGFYGIIGHLLGDMLTPWGVRPYRPVDDRKYTIDITNADSETANYLAWVLGAGTLVGAILFGTMFIPT